MRITDEMIKEAVEEIYREWFTIQSIREECRYEIPESIKEKMRALITMMYRREEERGTK